MLDVIENKKGERIDYTFHYGSDRNRYLFIVGHGVTGNKDHRIVTTLSEKIAHEGMSVLRFSFTGNGDSEGSFEESTISKEIEDLQSILSSATERGWRPIYAGHSMGAAVGVLTASIDSRIQLLVSLAGIVETEGFCKAEFGKVTPGEGFMWGDSRCPLSQEFVNDMKQIKSVLPRAAGIDIPWLLIHGTRDEVVSLNHSHSLILNFESSREFVEIDGADHLFSGEAISLVTDSVVDWLGRKLQVN